MPVIYIKKSPGSGIGVFDNLVGNQVVQGGGLTFGGFEFTPSLTEKATPSFYTNIFDKPMNLLDLGVSDISDIRNSVAKELNVIPNYDISQVFNFSLYGSLSKRISVSITKIINYFPASIDVSIYKGDLSTGFTATNVVYDINDTAFDIDISRIKNPFGIDFTKNASINVSSSEISISQYRDLTKYYKDYVLDINGSQYPIIFIKPTDSLTLGILRITVSGNPFGFGKNIANSFIIRPSNFLYDLIIKSNLDEVEQFILSTISNPKYTVTFQVPEETESGQFVIVNNSLTWPLDGIWNLDITTENFDNYLNKLQEIAEYFDGVKTNLISRFFVADSLKEFDTNDRRVESLLQIYGRSFDDVKKFIDSLGYMNSINYVPKNDIPNQLLQNLSKTLGWADNFDFLHDKSLIDSIFGDGDGFTYSAYSRTQTPLELNYIFYRNLVINSFYLFKSKGTRRPIDFLMRLFGIPDAMIQFNEHIYLADVPIDLRKFNNALSKLKGGFYVDSDPIFTNKTYSIEGVLYTGFSSSNNTIVVDYDINDYPIDYLTGYPKKVSNPNFYFQKGAGWFELTPTHRSLELPVRTVSGETISYSSEFEGFTYGQKYLDLFRQFPYINDGFSLTKTIDNKKSWNINDVFTRKSTNGDYNAYYFLSLDKLVLNVKNIDLCINPSQAILYDVWLQSFEKNYPIPQSGLTFNSVGAVNPNKNITIKDNTIIFPSPKTKTFFEFSQTFSSNMLNTRNRLYITDGKTGGYPVLQYLFWLYLEGQKNGIDTNQYSYENLIEYANYINPHWIKVVEQMIPATTIWTSGVRYENTPFHRQKYVYKRRLGCVVGEIPNKKVLSKNTEINIWYNKSTDMVGTYTALTLMKNSILKQCFLKYYNNDSLLYDNRVKIREFQGEASNKRTFNALNKLGTTSEIKSVINLVFQSDANPDYITDNFTINKTLTNDYVNDDNPSPTNTPTSPPIPYVPPPQSVPNNGVYNYSMNQTPSNNYTIDITNLRNSISTLSNAYYTGIVFRVDTKTTKSLDFKNLLIAIKNGDGFYKNNNGLSDKTQFNYALDITKDESQSYYASKIISSLNNMGYNLDNCGLVDSKITNAKTFNYSKIDEETINSDIFNGVCQKNLTQIISIPNDKFLDILKNNITKAKSSSNKNCDSNKALTTWYLEFKLGNTIINRTKFYVGLGDTDAPTQKLWSNTLTNVLPTLIKKNINYQEIGDDQLILTDLFCKTVNTDNKKMTLNISVDVTLICQ